MMDKVTPRTFSFTMAVLAAVGIAATDASATRISPGYDKPIYTPPPVYIPPQIDRPFIPPVLPDLPTFRGPTGDDGPTVVNLPPPRWVKPELTLALPEGMLLDMRISGDGRCMLQVTPGNTLRYWNLTLGIQRPQVTLPSQVAMIAAAPMPECDGAIVADADGSLRRVGYGVPPEISVLGNHGGEISVMQLSRDGQVLAVGGLDGSVSVWDVAGNRQLLAFDGHAGTVMALAISPDGSRLLTGGADRTARLWSLADGTPGPVLADHQGRVGSVAFGGGAIAVTATSSAEVCVWAADTGARRACYQVDGGPVQALAVDPGTERAVVAGSDSGLRLLDLGTGRVVRVMAGHGSAVRHLAFVGNGRLMSGGDDGTFRLWQMASGASLAQGLLTPDGWAVVDHQGRFDGSETGIDSVHWQGERMDLTLDSFSDQYYEPGVLAKHMAGRNDFITEPPGDIDNGMRPPPGVALELGAGQRITGQPFEVRVIVEDLGTGVADVRLYLNGKQVDPTAVRSRSQSVRDDGTPLAITVFRVMPVAGRNEFRAVATGDWGVESAPVMQVAEFSGPAPQRTLHIVAVGINQYANPGLNLNYAVDDAEALLARFEDADLGVFDAVREYRLLDQAATHANISQAFAALRNADPNDVLIVYLAGHGVVVDDQWFFLPHEMTEFSDGQINARGVSASELRDAVISTPAQRVLVMIDACRSGAGLMPFETLHAYQRREMRTVSRLAGISVLAAARKDQDAAELPWLGHGLFTHSVLAGLDGDADNTPRDGSVTAHEVVDFSQRAIPEISRKYTDDPQEPVAFAMGSDFAVQAVQ